MDELFDLEREEREKNIFINIATKISKGAFEIAKLFLVKVRKQHLYTKAEVFKLYKFFLKHDLVDQYSNQHTSICNAVDDNRIDIVKLLMRDPDVDLNTQSENAYYTACSRGYHEIVQLFLDDERIEPRNNTQYQKNIAIKVSARNGRYLTVETLLRDPRIIVDDDVFDFVMQPGPHVTSDYMKCVDILEKYINIPGELRAKHLRGEIESFEEITNLGSFGMF